jgi:hypothetical protein
MYMKYSSVCSEIWKRGDNVHEVQLYFMHIVTSYLCFTTQSCASCIFPPLFLCFTTHSCTSCTLSSLFLIFHYPQRNIKKRWQCTWGTAVCSETKKRGDNVHAVQLCVVKYKKEVTMYCHFLLMLHCTELYCMHIVTSFFIFHYTGLYFMYIVTCFPYFTTQRAVCSVCSEIWKRGENVHQVQLCV